MGASSSSQDSSEKRELPMRDCTATLYYFEGRGMADQIRWMLAAGGISFKQRVSSIKVITTRERFLTLTKNQLPFGQLPMLQIDNLELVQTQTIIRYLSKRIGIQGSTPLEEIQCDAIVEAVRDLLPFVTAAPFKRRKGGEEWAAHKILMIQKWMYAGSRFEDILASNPCHSTLMVGRGLTYADVLVAHVLTWFVEECGPEIVSTFPLLVSMQNTVLSLPGITAFIRSELFFPLGDDNYCAQVCHVLDREI